MSTSKDVLATVDSMAQRRVKALDSMNPARSKEARECLDKAEEKAALNGRAGGHARLGR